MVGPRAGAARRQSGAARAPRSAGLRRPPRPRAAHISRRCRSQPHVRARHTYDTPIPRMGIAASAVSARRQCAPNVSPRAQDRATSAPYRHSAATFATATNTARGATRRGLLTFRILTTASTALFPRTATLVFASRSGRAGALSPRFSAPTQLFDIASNARAESLISPVTKHFAAPRHRFDVCSCSV